MASADQPFDESFKILIIGNSDVGKTSLIFRFADGSFSAQYVSTVGIDFKNKIIVSNDKQIQLQIWDTAGQERFRSITTAYYRGAAGFVIVYDITNEVSFKDVQEWVSLIESHSGPEAKRILVGNMSDKEKERKVTRERGQELADQLGAEFIETSAKDNSNVEKVFQLLVESILKGKAAEIPAAEVPAAEVPAAEEKPPATKETDTIKLSDKPVSEAKDGCCNC